MPLHNDPAARKSFHSYLHACGLNLASRSTPTLPVTEGSETESKLLLTSSTPSFLAARPSSLSSTGLSSGLYPRPSSPPPLPPRSAMRRDSSDSPPKSVHFSLQVDEIPPDLDLELGLDEGLYSPPLSETDMSPQSRSLDRSNVPSEMGLSSGGDGDKGVDGYGRLTKGIDDVVTPVWYKCFVVAALAMFLGVTGWFVWDFLSRILVEVKE